MSFQDLESGRPLPSRRDYINGKQDPTQAVASGVFQINTSVSTFQRLVNTLGTPKDTPQLREKIHPMETQLQVQLRMYVVLAFLVLHFPDKSIGECTFNVDDKSHPDIISSFPCSQEYLMKSYFDKHDTLIDLDFQGFLAHELSLDSCKALPHNLSSLLKLSVLQRHLIGEGSHRRLFSSIRFHIQSEAITEPPEQFCQAIVVERLPSGVLADPFELQHLVQRGVFIDAAVFGDTNLELPSALSNRSVVEVHINIGSNILSRHKKGFEVNVELPLHTRYPPLDGSGYSRVKMGMPDLFLHCSFKENSQHENCVWMIMADSAESSTSAVVWGIPSGNKAHSGVVSVITFVSALLSTFLIVLAAVLYRYP